MTYEEALEAAKGGLEVYESKYPHLVEQIEFQKIVIEALKKQIPKRPNIEHQPICDLYKCPICNKLLIVYYPGMELFTGEETEFCDHCGQAIDWRKRNEQRNNKRSL